MPMNRLTTSDIHNEFKNLLDQGMHDSKVYRYDKLTKQKFIEIQDCHFIADDPYIVKHDKIIYDNDWYLVNY